MKNLLLVDDDKICQEKIKDDLSNANWNINIASNASEALKLIKENNFALILLDVVLPDEDGLNLIPKINQISPHTLIIVQTAYPTIDRAVRAIQLGAYDFIIKPFSNNVSHIINKAYSYWQSKYENSLLLEELKKRIFELEKSTETLNRERNKILALLKEIKEGVIMINNENKVYLINDVAVEIFQVNYNRESKKFICSSPNFKKVLENMIKVKEEKIAYLSLQFKIGEKKPKYYNVSIKSLSNNNFTEVIAIINDISEIIELHEMRANFISKLSHELRTPISIIKSTIDILKKKLYFEDTASINFLKIIDEQINQLNNKISQILSFSELYSGNVSLSMSMNNIIEVLKTELNRLIPKFQSKDLNFSLQMPTEVPDFVFDNEKIALVFHNYLENAYKFSPNGGSISINLKIIDRLSELGEIIPAEIKHKIVGKTLIISIKDEGPGIESQERKYIFEPFFQSETIYEHSNGMGLGLYIAKSIIEAHGGATWVQNNYPHGSIFYILLPILGDEKLKPPAPLFKLAY